MQCRRLNSSEPEDCVFLLRRESDFAFLVVALARLRRAASLAAKVSTISSEIAAAVRAFDTAMPCLKRLRDTAEHFDDYAQDRGRRTAIARQQLEVAHIDREGPTLHWLDCKLNASEALSASQLLVRAIDEVAPLVARDA